MSNERIIQCDVLVIGGGIAGCMAAIKAKEAGAKVVLVDKGFFSRTGQSPYVDSHLVPKMYATDNHELRQAHEARNMVLISEMRLRSSLFRTESRCCHYREDYPYRDDANWLAWTLIKTVTSNKRGCAGMTGHTCARIILKVNEFVIASA